LTYLASLLDICCALGNVLEGDAGELQFVLLILGWLDINTWVHDDLAHDLLADEVTVESVSPLSLQMMLSSYPSFFDPWIQKSLHVPDLDLVQASVCVLLEIDVDWEMGVDVSHLVLEATGDTNDPAHIS
jgi:hypothetical protein